ncbi:MAG: hypothetical protein AAF828_06655 [Bacteroidota bacterium]
MVTYFNRKDLISFGQYLMSQERRNRFEAAYKEAIRSDFDIPPTEERLRHVHHADVENWMKDQRQKKD